MERRPSCFLALASVLLILLAHCASPASGIVNHEPPPGKTSTPMSPPTPTTAATFQLVTPTATSKTATVATPTMAQPQEPVPGVSVGGGTVQNGPFTFCLWIYRDPSLNQNPVTPSLYSDMNGYGAYLYWVYNGKEDLPGPVTEWWGVEPNLQALNTYARIKPEAQGGRSGGIWLPGGFFISGQSQAGETQKLIIQVSTPGKTYGAALSFTLRGQTLNWQPDEIQKPVILTNDA